MRQTTFKSKFSFLSIALLGLSACGANSAGTLANKDELSAIQENTHKNQMNVSKQDTNKQKKAANMLTLQGQIVYQTMEGGFFSFIANDGGKYTPMQLPKAHQQHGLIVELQAQVLHDVITTTQFGQVIKVIDVKVIDESKVSTIPKER
jgi:hypothetical protein